MLSPFAIGICNGSSVICRPVRIGRLSAVEMDWARKILPSVWWFEATFFEWTFMYFRCGPLAGEVRNDEAKDDERLGGGMEVGDVGEVALSNDGRTGERWFGLGGVVVGDEDEDG